MTRRTIRRYAHELFPHGDEGETRDHMASTGDVTGHGIVTRIDCPESECPTCTEEAPNA